MSPLWAQWVYMWEAGEKYVNLKDSFQENVTEFCVQGALLCLPSRMWNETEHWTAWHVEGSSASAEGETSVLGGNGSTVRFLGKDGWQEGVPSRVDMRPSLGTHKTFLRNISVGKSLWILIHHVTMLEYTGLRKRMVFETSQTFFYFKMLTNMAVCYTFLSVLQIGISRGMHCRLLLSKACKTLLEIIYLQNSLKPWKNGLIMSFMNYLNIRQGIHSNQNTLILNDVLCFRP